jgi:hypothetical protein
VNDLDLVSGRHAMFGVTRAGDDGPIDLDGDRPLAQSEVRNQIAHGDAIRDFSPRAIDRDLHALQPTTMMQARPSRRPQFQAGSELAPHEGLQLAVVSA